MFGSKYETVLLFGGTGTLGHAILRLWGEKKVGQFIVFSRDENKHWKLKNTFPHLKIISELGDIGSYSHVKQCLQKYNPNVILVLSAMKHIDYGEKFVDTCLKTNVYGIFNVIRAVNTITTLSVLSKILFVSTDKACAPVNIYGLSKSIAERIILNTECRVPVVAVRYGNVVNSSGSIIPIFLNQAVDEKQKHFTITHEEMTRFIITLEQSVQLIEDALDFAIAREIYIPMVPAIKIFDLARVFHYVYQKPLKRIGIRMGEKLHESMFSALEKPFIVKKVIHDRHIYILQHARQEEIKDVSIPEEFTSQTNIISLEQLLENLQPFIPKKIDIIPLTEFLSQEYSIDD